jgi:hypothetical protein
MAQRVQNHPYAVPLFTAYDLQRDKPWESRSFLDLSVLLTGFSEAELKSTGLPDAFFKELGLVVGRPIRAAFLKAATPLKGGILQDVTWAPLARNVVRMWYVGQWQHMPVGWTANFSKADAAAYDEFGRDVDRVLSPDAYVEGLVWRAIGVNPPGARQPGFASWARKL